MPFFVVFVPFVVNSLCPPVLLRNRHPFPANLPAPSEARQAGTHGQALGYLVPWTYIEQEVRLPEPALDLAQISF